MVRVGRFEKVSYRQFCDDMNNEYCRKGWFTEDELRRLYDAIQLPARATSGSAGYDFKAPFSFQLNPGQTIKIPTGIQAHIAEGWWLGCLPRSGLGFKYRLQLDNTMGVIDSDYSNSDNEGHIFAKITNDTKDGKMLVVHAGDRFMQAIFIPYGIVYNDSVDVVRNGGCGSTDAQAAV